MIIYTADVRAGTTQPVLDVDCLQMKLLEAFLVEVDGESILQEMNAKLEQTDTLNDRDQMRLIVSPLTFVGTEAKVDAAKRAIRIADKIRDEDTEWFILQMIKVMTNKFISEEDVAKIKEVVGMTKLDRLYEEEKRQAVKDAVHKKDQEMAQQKKQIAQNLLREGISDEKVAACMGLTVEKVRSMVGAGA